MLISPDPGAEHRDIAMISGRRVFPALFLVLFLSSCSAGRASSRPDGAEALSLSALHALFDAQVSNDSNLTNVVARGFFHYKDAAQDVNLSVLVRHDEAASFTRITFYGNLEEDYWGDILVYKGNVSLYFPIDQTLHKGKISNFDLYPFARIHIQLSELLNLALGRVYLIDDYEKQRGAASKDHYVLNIQNEKEVQQLFFARDTSLVMQCKIFHYQGDSLRERATVKYDHHKAVDGLLIPHKTDLSSLQPRLRAVIWFKDFSRDYVFSESDAVLLVPEGTQESGL
jgi:hypothetical protein